MTIAGLSSIWPSAAGCRHNGSRDPRGRGHKPGWLPGATRGWRGQRSEERRDGVDEAVAQGGRDASWYLGQGGKCKRGFGERRGRGEKGTRRGLSCLGEEGPSDNLA